MSTTIPISIPGPAQINVTLTSTGPRGATGPAGGTAVTATAGETLSSGRVVVISAGTAVYFQPGTAAHAGRCYGITTSSATAGNTVNIQIGGEVSDLAFTFSTDSALYAGTNGVVTQTKPAAPNLVQPVGASISATKMRINFETPLTQIN